MSKTIFKSLNEEENLRNSRHESRKQESHKQEMRLDLTWAVFIGGHTYVVEKESGL